MTKLYFYLPSNFIYLSSEKNSGGIDVFSVNQLENDKTSGNMESSAYCRHISFKVFVTAQNNFY